YRAACGSGGSVPGAGGAPGTGGGAATSADEASDAGGIAAESGKIAESDSGIDGCASAGTFQPDIVACWLPTGAFSGTARANSAAALIFVALLAAASTAFAISTADA